MRIAVSKQPVEHIEHHQRPRIADMDIVIDRRSTDIHAHMAIVERCKSLFRADQRIMELERHWVVPRVKLRGDPVQKPRSSNVFSR